MSLFIFFGFFFNTDEIATLVRYAKDKGLIATNADTVYMAIDASMLEHKSSDYGTIFKIGTTRYKIVNRELPKRSPSLAIEKVTYEGSGKFSVKCIYKEAAHVEHLSFCFKFNEYDDGLAIKDSMVIYNYYKGVSIDEDDWQPKK